MKMKSPRQVSGQRIDSIQAVFEGGPLCFLMSMADLLNQSRYH